MIGATANATAKRDGQRDRRDQNLAPMAAVTSDVV